MENIIKNINKLSEQNGAILCIKQIDKIKNEACSGEGFLGDLETNQNKKAQGFSARFLLANESAKTTTIEADQYTPTA